MSVGRTCRRTSPLGRGGAAYTEAKAGVTDSARQPEQEFRAEGTAKPTALRSSSALVLVLQLGEFYKALRQRDLGDRCSALPFRRTSPGGRTSGSVVKSSDCGCFIEIYILGFLLIKTWGQRLGGNLASSEGS